MRWSVIFGTRSRDCGDFEEIGVSRECAQGVKVTLQGDGVKRETATDSYGDFEFEGLDQNQDYQVRVDLKGYASMIIDVNTQTDVNLGEIVLEPLKK